MITFDLFTIVDETEKNDRNIQLESQTYHINNMPICIISYSHKKMLEASNKNSINKEGLKYILSNNFFNKTKVKPFSSVRRKANKPESFID